MATATSFVYVDSDDQKMDTNGNQQYHQQTLGSKEKIMGYDNSNSVIILTPNESCTKIYSKQQTDCMMCSILNMLFCCFPIGLAALYFARRSREAEDRMDYVRSQEDARKVDILNFIGILIGSITLLSIATTFAVIDRFFSAVYYINDESDGKKMDLTSSRNNQTSDKAAYDPHGNVQNDQQILNPQGYNLFLVENSIGSGVPINNIMMTHSQDSTPNYDMKCSREHCGFVYWILLNVIFCCFPIIIAVVCSSYRSGSSVGELDFERSRKRANRTSLMMCGSFIIATVVFFTLFLLYRFCRTCDL